MDVDSPSEKGNPRQTGKELPSAFADLDQMSRALGFYGLLISVCNIVGVVGILVMWTRPSPLGHADYPIMGWIGICVATTVLVGVFVSLRFEHLIVLGNALYQELSDEMQARRMRLDDHFQFRLVLRKFVDTSTPLVLRGLPIPLRGRARRVSLVALQLFLLGIVLWLMRS